MKQKKTRRGRIALVILTAILILLGALCCWQWGNIKAFVTFATHSGEELEEQIQQNNQTIKDAVEANPDITVREITDEERKALQDGTLTMEELMERLKRPYEPLNPAPAEPETPVQPETPSEPETPVIPTTPTETPAQPEKPAEPEPSPEETAYQKELNDILARVYVLREEFVIELDKMKDEAVADYKKLGEDKSGLSSFVKTYIRKATALERECDGKMDVIMEDLVALQEANGKDMELVNTVASTYAKEKSLKKAWYMNELQRRGLI